MKETLEQHQIKLIQKLKKVLEYHFQRFVAFEGQASPSIPPKEKFREYVSAHEHIKYELEAYLAQVGKLIFFLRSIENKYSIKSPEDLDLKSMWETFHLGGMIYALRMKWIAHRSYDDPHEEPEDLHAHVLLNLEQNLTMWDQGHMLIDFNGEGFNLCDFHPRILNFLDWMEKEIIPHLTKV